jgi:hypothetical protein
VGEAPGACCCRRATSHLEERGSKVLGIKDAAVGADLEPAEQRPAAIPRAGACERGSCARPRPRGGSVPLGRIRVVEDHGEVFKVLVVVVQEQEVEAAPMEHSDGLRQRQRQRQRGRTLHSQRERYRYTDTQTHTHTQRHTDTHTHRERDREGQRGHSSRTAALWRAARPARSVKTPSAHPRRPRFLAHLPLYLTLSHSLSLSLSHESVALGSLHHTRATCSLLARRGEKNAKG